MKGSGRSRRYGNLARAGDLLSRAAAVLTIVLAAACRSGAESGDSTPDADREPAPASDVVLRVESDRAFAGGTVTLVLNNGSDGTIGYNLCTSVLERGSGGGWQPLPSDRVCTMELRTLEPGRVADYPLDLPEDLAPGTYRAATGVERLETGRRETVVSEAFEVE